MPAACPLCCDTHSSQASLVLCCGVACHTGHIESCGGRLQRSANMRHQQSLQGNISNYDKNSACLQIQRTLSAKIALGFVSVRGRVAAELISMIAARNTFTSNLTQLFTLEEAHEEETLNVQIGRCDAVRPAVTRISCVTVSAQLNAAERKKMCYTNPHAGTLVHRCMPRQRGYQQNPCRRSPFLSSRLEEQCGHHQCSPTRSSNADPSQRARDEEVNCCVAELAAERHGDDACSATVLTLGATLHIVRVS